MATQTMNLKLRTIKLCKYGTSNMQISFKQLAVLWILRNGIDQDRTLTQTR